MDLYVLCTHPACPLRISGLSCRSVRRNYRLSLGCAAATHAQSPKTAARPSCRRPDSPSTTPGVPTRCGPGRQPAAGRLPAETGDVVEHPEYEQAGRDLRLGDQLRAIRRTRNLTQKEVAERAGISQPALSRIELGGGVPDIETLRKLGNAMGVRFRVIVGDEDAEQEENLRLTGQAGAGQAASLGSSR
jgi:DNA-binding XRE family transcriptional regulator